MHAHCAGSLARLRSHLLAVHPPLPTPAAPVHPGHRTPARTAGPLWCCAARCPSPSSPLPPAPALSHPRPPLRGAPATLLLSLPPAERGEAAARAAVRIAVRRAAR